LSWSQPEENFMQLFHLYVFTVFIISSQQQQYAVIICNSLLGCVSIHPDPCTCEMVPHCFILFYIILYWHVRYLTCIVDLWKVK
jgi:hypothetical protein